MAQLAKTSRQLVANAADFEAADKFMELIDAEQKALEALEDHAAALPPGEVVGALLRFPRGDGYALYLVTKARPLTLQWVEFGDRWQIDYPTIRGLRLADVERMIEGDRRMRALFAQKG